MVIAVTVAELLPAFLLKAIGKSGSAFVEPKPPGVECAETRRPVEAKKITLGEAQVFRTIALFSCLLLAPTPDAVITRYQKQGSAVTVPASYAEGARDARRSAVTGSGTFQAVTYNIAGLPDVISRSNPGRNTAAIGRLLNAYDLVLVQEDFFYHSELLSTSRHPYRSQPYAGSSLIGDGLNQLSVFPFSPLQREAWTDCNGYISASMDCWASKGFTFSRLRVADGIEFDVYNLHLDAGGSRQDQAVRRSNIKQLLRSVETVSVGRPVIIGGDTNLEYGEASDERLLDDFRRRGGFRIACREASCKRESKDRFLFRSGGSIQLNVLGWSVPAEFVDGEGNALSDHAPVVVTYHWEYIPHSSTNTPHRDDNARYRRYGGSGETHAGANHWQGVGICADAKRF